MKADITIMPGDGVGPEITREAVKVLQAIGSVFDHDFSLNDLFIHLFYHNNHGDDVERTIVDHFTIFLRRR